MNRRSLLTLSFVALVPTLASAGQKPEPLPAGSSPAPGRLAWFARYQEARSGPESTETVTRTFKVGASGSLDITNLAGAIVVTGTPGDQIVVTAVKRVRGNAPDARAQMDAILIDASETSGRVEVRTVARRMKQLSTWVDYTVQVPYGTAVAARSLAGDVKVMKVKGDVQLESTNGTVEAIGTPRLVRVKTVSGDILLSDAAAGDALAASTVSGRLVAKMLKAKSLDFASISGDVVLVNTSCERAQVRSVNGALEFLGPLIKGGRYEFISHSGDVRLKLGGPAGFEIAAKTFSGDVRSEMDLTLDPVNPNLPPGVPQHRDVRGTFGDGGALVLVKTFSGSVVVGRAAAEKSAPETKPEQLSKPKPKPDKKSREK